MSSKLECLLPVRGTTRAILATVLSLAGLVSSVVAASEDRTGDQPNQPVGLRFSANPTKEEIFKARVFEEPLVPVGGEPSTQENADLATALIK